MVNASEKLLFVIMTFVPNHGRTKTTSHYHVMPAKISMLRGEFQLEKGIKEVEDRKKILEQHRNQQTSLKAKF